jgi:menaquinone-dependent protoporphyrinogen IX oxidase
MRICGTAYDHLGPTSLERGDRQKVARRLVRKLAELGFQVKLRDVA